MSREQKAEDIHAIKMKVAYNSLILSQQIFMYVQISSSSNAAYVFANFSAAGSEWSIAAPFISSVADAYVPTRRDNNAEGPAHISCYQ